MNRQKIALGTFLLGAALACGAASADSVTATLYNTPQGVDPGSDTLNVSFGSDSYSPGWAGQINWHNASSANWSGNGGLNSELHSILGAGGTFSTYCIEGTQNVYFGSSEIWSNGVVTLANAPDPGTPNTFTSTQIADLTSFWNRFYDIAGTSNELATAFQVGIWEIANDDASGLAADLTAHGSYFGGGVFKASVDTNLSGADQTFDSNVLTDATNWLNTVKGGGTYTTKYALFALTDPGIQDQLFAVSVPLPAALPAGLALLSSLGLVRFMRRRRSQ